MTLVFIASYRAAIAITFSPSRRGCSTIKIIMMLLLTMSMLMLTVLIPFVVRKLSTWPLVRLVGRAFPVQCRRHSYCVAFHNQPATSRGAARRLCRANQVSATCTAATLFALIFCSGQAFVVGLSLLLSSRWFLLLLCVAFIDGRRRSWRRPGWLVVKNLPHR